MKNYIQDTLNRLNSKSNRSSLIIQNVFASIAIKGWSVIVQLLLVPLTLSCLGVYENGVWLTISSVFIWIDNFDIGLGNGLRNQLAVSIARNDYAKAKEVVSSTFAMLAVIIIPIVSILIILELAVDNYAIFNVDNTIVKQLDTILIVSTFFVCTTFIFKFLGNFYMGLQLPAMSNLIQTAGNTLALIGTFLVYLSGKHSMLLIAISNTAAPLLVYLLCYPLTFYGKYSHLRPSWSCVKMTTIKELFSVGVKFFVLQMVGIILFFSSNIIISRLLSPAYVTPYQIAHRYFMIATLVFTIICVPFWSATTDAYERKDFEWIKRSNRILNLVILGIFLLITIMIFISGFVYDIWIHDRNIVPLSITVITGLYQFILIWSTRYSFVLNGIGALRLQLICSVCAAIIYIPIAILVGRTTQSINWLLLVMCVINIPGLIVNFIQYDKLINNKAKGIWKK
jgi:O-antigen/teichoic acid export membrane protein